MIVRWLMANTKAIEVRTRDGKTYYVVTDPTAFRDGVGRLLAEVQRIKAEGDYPAARLLFETYGVHFDPAAARRSRRARREAEPAVVHRVRDAEARAVDERLRRDHRRRHFVSAWISRSRCSSTPPRPAICAGSRRCVQAVMRRVTRSTGPAWARSPSWPSSSPFPPALSGDRRRRATLPPRAWRSSPPKIAARPHRPISPAFDPVSRSGDRADRAHCGPRAGASRAARADRRHRAGPEAFVARSSRRGRQRHRPGGAGVDTRSRRRPRREPLSIRRSPR